MSMCGMKFEKLLHIFSLRFSTFIHDSTHKSEKLKYDQKGSLMPALLNEEIYKEYIYFAYKTMCEYSTFSEKMETLKVFIKTEEEEKEGKEDILMHHTCQKKHLVLTLSS